MGVVSQMLGIKINYNQDKGLTTLDMSGYIKRSLIKFNLENVRMYKMPIEPNYEHSAKHAPQTGRIIIFEKQTLRCCCRNTQLDLYDYKTRHRIRKKYLW